jgi:hypothetical protein
MIIFHLGLGKNWSLYVIPKHKANFKSSLARSSFEQSSYNVESLEYQTQFLHRIILEQR